MARQPSSLLNRKLSRTHNWSPMLFMSFDNLNESRKIFAFSMALFWSRWLLSYTWNLKPLLKHKKNLQSSRKWSAIVKNVPFIKRVKALFSLNLEKKRTASWKCAHAKSINSLRDMIRTKYELYLCTKIDKFYVYTL